MHQPIRNYQTILLAVLVITSACSSANISTSPETTTPAVASTTPAITGIQGPDGLNSPVRIGGFEGLAVEDAQIAASEAGWEFLEVRDIDFEEPNRLADYCNTTIGLFVENGVVIEAWSGGYRP